MVVVFHKLWQEQSITLLMNCKKPRRGDVCFSSLFFIKPCQNERNKQKNGFPHGFFLLQISPMESLLFSCCTCGLCENLLSFSRIDHLAVEDALQQNSPTVNTHTFAPRNNGKLRNKKTGRQLPLEDISTIGCLDFWRSFPVKIMAT